MNCLLAINAQCLHKKRKLRDRQLVKALHTARLVTAGDLKRAAPGLLKQTTTAMGMARRASKGLMSKTMVLHVHFESWCILL